ncbi:MAG: hypothetical protein CMJ31_14100 [Phycisphaerae bacterium]|nr:hypothetical protein [Phycisphaerae bacterium]
MRISVANSIRAAFVALAVTGSTLSAQPLESDTPAPPTRESIHERLRGLLDRLEAAEARTKDAIGLLDAGAPLREVFQALPPEDAAFGGGLFRGEGRWREGGHPSDGERRPDRPGREPRPFKADIPEPTAEELRAFMESHMPRMAERLTLAEGDEPGSAERLMKRLTPRLSKLMATMDRDPERGAAEIAEMRTGLEVIRLAREQRHGAAIDRATIRDALEAHFDARLAIAELDLKQAAAQLERGRAELRERRASRDEHIEHKLEEFDREPAGRKGRGD